ncbi:MAG: hypothetical protein LIO59_04780 [Oscillospiraceae bacterium]|nr:hypothetical protein [Oscillospiraceae bacterium]
MRNKEILNQSGCVDYTAFKAIKNTAKTERKNLIEDLKQLAEKRGYRIVGKIRLDEIKEDK